MPGNDLRAAAALFALPFSVFGRALLPGQVLSPADNLTSAWPWKAVAPDVVPSNPLLADVSSVLHPWLIYAGREIAEGRFPLWNPHAFGGAPLLAAAQPALLFPLTALAYVLPAALALTLIAILKCSGAGLAMYWLLRGLALTVPAAFIGALAFMFSGPIVVWLHAPIATVLALVPLALGTVHRLRERGGSRWLAAVSVAVALAIVAGYPQGALYAIGAASVWALTLASGAPGGAWRFLARFGVATALGVLLAGVQLVPFLEYLGESAVAAYRAEWVPFMYLPPRSMVTLFLPHYYGTPAGRDYWGPYNFNVVSVSVGVVPWLVLPVALAAARRLVAVRYFAALGLVAAAMLYGAPGARTLAAVPPLSLTGNTRVAVLLVVALAVLAAFGVDAVARGDALSRSRVATLLRAGVIAPATLALFFVATDSLALPRGVRSASLAAQYVFWLGLLVLGGVLSLGWLRDGARRWAIALAAVQLGSTLPLSATYQPVIDARLLYPELPALTALRKATAQDGTRILTGAHNVTMLYGLSEQTGYDAMTPRRIEAIAGPIGTGRTVGLLGTEPLTAGAVFASPALDLMAVRHLLVPPGTTPGDRFVLEYEGPDARVYRNDAAMPRAMVVARARCVDDAEAIALIRQRAIDFRREVLLAPPCQPLPPAGASAGESRASVREHRADAVVVDIATDVPGYLVLADTWFPGWRAWVDDVPQPIHRANHAFRAIRLDPGSHVVRFRYRPGSVGIGLVASILAAVVLVVVLCRRASGR